MGNAVLSWIKRLFFVLIGLIAVVVVAVYLLFGRGTPYIDLTTEPIFPQGTLEVAVTSERPIGNAAVSDNGRIFFTIHPESNPVAPFLYEWVDGAPVPYLSDKLAPLLQSPLGLAIDAQNKLWIIDPAHHGTGQPRLIAVDLNENRVTQTYDFDRDMAPIGSFLQDLQVSFDGRWVYIADVGFWAKRPAIVVYDTQEDTARRVLNRHNSVYPQNILIQNQIKDMSFFGGLIEMKTGIDGIALSRQGDWLYYGAMNHDTLYRVPTAVLQDFDSTEASIEDRIEAVGQKPLNDGFSIDDENNVLITDVEHQAIHIMAPDGALSTLIKDDRVRWADGLSYGPDGWLYLADSAIPHLALQDAGHHAAQAPYYIWRFRPNTAGAPGQ